MVESMVESPLVWFLPPENRIGGRVRLDSRDRLQFEATKIHTGARKREVPLSVRIPLATLDQTQRDGARRNDTDLSPLGQTLRCDTDRTLPNWTIRRVT